MANATTVDLSKVDTNAPTYRAAELALHLQAYAAACGFAAPVHHLAYAVTMMQAEARRAKRRAENACNYGYRDDAHEKRMLRAEARAEEKINAALFQIFAGGGPDGHQDPAPTVELGGDPRGPCARLHIPGQRGDGWGDGFGIY